MPDLFGMAHGTWSCCFVVPPRATGNYKQGHIYFMILCVPAINSFDGERVTIYSPQTLRLHLEGLVVCTKT